MGPFEEVHIHAGATVGVATKEEAYFDSRTSLERWRTRSGAANAKMQTLHHSPLAGYSTEDRTAFAGDLDMTKRVLEHGLMEGMRGRVR